MIPKTSSPKLKRLLTETAANLRRDLAETKKPCDRAGLWENQKNPNVR